MSLKRWEKQVLGKRGAAKRVHEIEDELRLVVAAKCSSTRAKKSSSFLCATDGIDESRSAISPQHNDNW